MLRGEVTVRRTRVEQGDQLGGDCSSPGEQRWGLDRMVVEEEGRCGSRPGVLFFKNLFN